MIIIFSLHKYEISTHFVLYFINFFFFLFFFFFIFSLFCKVKTCFCIIFFMKQICMPGKNHAFKNSKHKPSNILCLSFKVLFDCCCIYCFLFVVCFSCYNNWGGWVISCNSSFCDSFCTSDISNYSCDYLPADWPVRCIIYKSQSEALY